MSVPAGDNSTSAVLGSSAIAVHNFETTEDDDFKRCWALSNLQLLPAFDNLSKGSKIDKPFQPSLIFS